MNATLSLPPFLAQLRASLNMPGAAPPADTPPRQPEAPDDASLAALSRSHGQRHAAAILLYGVNAGMLADFAATQKYAALVRRWQEMPTSDGWRFSPSPGDTELYGPAPYTDAPDMSRQAGPPLRDRSPWTGGGYSEQQEAAFRKGFLEVVEGFAAAFKPDTWQWAHYTLRMIAEEIYDVHKALRYQAGTTTAEEGEQAMNTIVSNVNFYGSYWGSDEMKELESLEPPPRDSTVLSSAPPDTARPPEGLPDLTGRLVDAADLADHFPPPSDPLVTGAFDLGDKIALLGSSKSRKSFFLLHLALCLATGTAFLGLRVPHRRRVLFVNLELKPAHLHRRLNRQARALGIVPSELRGWFSVFNARGLGLSPKQLLGIIHGIAEKMHAEIVIIDPLYKVAEGDENSAKDMKPILASFDKLANDTGAAVAYSHHDAKGSPGDRDIRDRGAGSNVIGRDYDAGITVTPHRIEAGAVVIEFLCRNYKSPARFAARFEEDGCIFVRADNLMPDVASSKPPRATESGERWREYFEPAISLALEQAWLKGEYVNVLVKRFGLSSVQAEKLYRAVRDDERIYTAKGPNKGVTPRHFIGLEALVLKKIQELKNQGGVGSD